MTSAIVMEQKPNTFGHMCLMDDKYAAFGIMDDVRQSDRDTKNTPQRPSAVAEQRVISPMMGIIDR